MNPETLIDREVLQRARERHQAAAAALAKANADLEAATKALQAAVVASERAVSGVGELSPLEAERQLQDARLALTVAEKVRVATERALRNAADNLKEANARSWAPVYVAAVRARVSAAAKADQARALLKEAEAEHQEATGLATLAFREGAAACDPAYLDKPMRTEVEERAFWRGVQFDIERGTWPWLQQFDGRP